MTQIHFFQSAPMFSSYAELESTTGGFSPASFLGKGSHGSVYIAVHGKLVVARIRFALQTTKAVETLHSSNPPVIHRDIKSSNVLVDRNWNARLGNFGFTPPAGTLGYLDPGYVLPENLSTKSDVFSFGILLLEIISSRNAIDVNYSPPSVVDWALPLTKQFEFSLLFDPRIGPPGDSTWIAAGGSCMQPKSTGPVDTRKMGSSSYQVALVRRKSSLALSMPHAMRLLNKSRLLQTEGLVRGGERRLVFQLVKNPQFRGLGHLGVSRLVVRVQKGSQKKILDKKRSVQVSIGNLKYS
uniref:Protein kinase domain-containing protein n=1 Tax=Nelumbo nucifera TaxID=4432 RepID=A0A822YUI1_NELNU|nr:TPA_asm: hypothetical protein HUJ06_006973 [Nelumbo nucifera]